MSAPGKNVPKLSQMEYRVVKDIGNGAGSVIRLIYDDMTGKQYALKVVERKSDDDDIYIQQTQHEFDVVSKLYHPAIIKIYDCQVKRTWLKKVTSVELLMEYLNGHTLESYSEALDEHVEGKSPEALRFKKIRRFVIIFNNVAAALDYMHHHGVFHADLKPSNVMTTLDKKVRVIDFGTAWLKGDEKQRVQGTPQYMAPEQATSRIVNEMTDIYNFGATMYRVFTGEYANLTLPNELSTSYRNKKSPKDWNPDIPRALSELIDACRAHDARDRPNVIYQVQERLVQIAKKLGVELSGP